ncbi:MAG: HDOD domain-containing protein [Gammaproteobacteria bacterium]
MVQEVRAELIEAINSNRIVLPTLPEVALRIREAAEDPDTDIASITRTIEQDAAISARVIRVSNSPLMRAANPITDLRMAISRLGVQYSCNLAVGLAMQQMFQATSQAVDQRMREVWSRSTEVAGISAVLARTYTRLKTDEAMLAGLVHKIGALPILRHAEDERRLLARPEVLDLLIDRLHGEIGKLILETWGFPPELVCVPVEYLDFARKPARADYTDIVMVANLQSYLGSEHPLGSVDWKTVGAFARIGLDPDVSAFEEEDLSAAMAASVAALQ